MKDDKLKIKAAKLYHTLLPNGGSFHNLSPSTRTYKEFMKLIEKMDKIENIIYYQNSKLTMLGGIEYACNALEDLQELKD